MVKSKVAGIASNSTDGQRKMAESLTSHEIEDVLSSIRRLVSEDLRPSMRPVAGAAAAPRITPRPAPVPAERLILTPSLRVAEEAVVAEPPALTGEVVAAPEPDSTAFDEAFADAEDADWAAPGEDDADYVEDIETAAQVAPAQPPRGHWTAETMPEVAWLQAEDDWAPEEAVPFVAHRRRGAAPVDVGVPTETFPEAIKPEPEPLLQEATRLAPMDARLDHATEQAIVEAAVAATAQGIVEGVVGDKATDRAPDDAAVSQLGAESLVPAAGLFEAEPGLIDEALLRDMVRAIIREELAGTLGERITRNVRKLVRIEVNRAMTSRDFE